MPNRRTAMLIAAFSVVGAACGATGPAGPVASASASPSSPSSPSTAPTGTPAASARSSEAPLRVTGLTLRADPKESVATCPVKVTFSATITVTGQGDVAYRWRSSDGDVSPVDRVSFAGPGSMTVSSTWTVDAGTVPTHAGWSSFELVDPALVLAAPSAARATFTFTCPTDDDIEAIGFGIGGSDADCSIAKHLDTFTDSDEIRVVASFWPSLPAGTTVTIRLTRAGTIVDGYPVTTHLDVSTKCVHGNVSNGNLAAGHYRLDVEPDTARGIGGEFDVR